MVDFNFLSRAWWCQQVLDLVNIDLIDWYFEEHSFRDTRRLSSMVSGDIVDFFKEHSLSLLARIRDVIILFIFVLWVSYDVEHIFYSSRQNSSVHTCFSLQSERLSTFGRPKEHNAGILTFNEALDCWSHNWSIKLLLPIAFIENWIEVEWEWLLLAQEGTKIISQTNFTWNIEDPKCHWELRLSSFLELDFHFQLPHMTSPLWWRCNSFCHFRPVRFQLRKSTF